MNTDDVTDLARRLREALEAADFTYDAVAELIGPRAHAALSRNETAPARAMTGDGTPLATLTRVFLLQHPVPRADLDNALPTLVEPLMAQGFFAVEANGDVRALLDIRPYAAELSDLEEHLWVVSDLTPGLDGRPLEVGAAFVLGISPASVSLAQLTKRERVGAALDLGTGCGVQALHLAPHAQRVVATDVNPRALELARFNAVLNNLDDAIEVRDGSLFEPVAGERFDLIATNPPFVISPAAGEQLVYRDSGLPGDEVIGRIVTQAPDHLTEGGWLQVLANWAIVADQPWQERLEEWLRPGDDALIVQREVMDPAAYVELWLKDAGHHGGPDYAERYDAWLSWFDAQRIEGIGFGWINVRARHGSQPQGEGGVHELLDWPYDVEQPIAPAIAEWAAAVDLVRDHPELGALRLVTRADVIQETQGPPGAEDPATIVLRQQRGLRRARKADTVEAALVGACDGELRVSEILGALAQLLDEDEASLAGRYAGVVAELVREGFLGLE